MFDYVKFENNIVEQAGDMIKQWMEEHKDILFG